MDTPGPTHKKDAGNVVVSRVVGRRGRGSMLAAAAAVIAGDQSAGLGKTVPRQVFKTNSLGIEVPVKGMLEPKRRTNRKPDDVKRRAKRLQVKASRKANRR